MPSEFVSRSAEPRLKASYFDASAWSRLARDPKCEDIVAELRRRQVIVLASVISAGEILKTPDIGLRKRLCSLMLNLHGDGPLLERPMTLAAGAASAFLEGETDFLLPQSRPGRSLLAFLYRPDDIDRQSIADWIDNLDGSYQQFLAKVKPERPNRSTRYYSEEILRSNPFLRLLASCPAARQLELSPTQVAHLCSSVDILAGSGGHARIHGYRGDGPFSQAEARAEAPRRPRHLAGCLPGCGRSLRQR